MKFKAVFLWSTRMSGAFLGGGGLLLWTNVLVFGELGSSVCGWSILGGVRLLLVSKKRKEALGST